MEKETDLNEWSANGDVYFFNEFHRVEANLSVSAVFKYLPDTFIH